MDVQIYKLEVRNRAIGMLLSGKTQLSVANMLEKDIRTIQRWWSRYQGNQTLQHRRGAGRPKNPHRFSKIVISKSLGKRRKSTRNFAKKLTSMCNPVSKDTVHRYLTKNFAVYPYKRRKCPKLTANQKDNRVKFCKAKVDGLLKTGDVYSGQMSPHLSYIIHLMYKTIESGPEIIAKFLLAKLLNFLRN